jgi:hypothetical protein
MPGGTVTVTSTGAEGEWLHRRRSPDLHRSCPGRVVQPGQDVEVRRSQRTRGVSACEGKENYIDEAHEAERNAGLSG